MNWQFSFSLERKLKDGSPPPGSMRSQAMKESRIKLDKKNMNSGRLMMNLRIRNTALTLQFIGSIGKKVKKYVIPITHSQLLTMTNEFQSNSSIPAELPIDPNEPLYCYCQQVSYGEMVACDNTDVRICSGWQKIIVFKLTMFLF